MSQPLLALLRRLDPNGGLDVLADAGIAPVYRAMPEVARLFATPRPYADSGLLQRLHVAVRLARQEYDRAFLLRGGKRVAMLAWLAGIPVRKSIGTQSWPAQAHPAAPPEQSNASRIVERFAQLAFDPAHPLPLPIPNPVLARSPTRELAARSKAGIEPHAPLLVLCPGGDDAAIRRWPARHFAAVASMLASEWPDAAMALVGSRRDRGFATEIAALSGQRLKNLCGELRLGDALALLAQAQGVITNDNALMHVAAAYGRPMVAVFGPSDPRAAAPRSSLARIEWLHLECSPCDSQQCRFGHAACLNGISPQAVFLSLCKAMQFVERDIR